MTNMEIIKNLIDKDYVLCLNNEISSYLPEPIIKMLLRSDSQIQLNNNGVILKLSTDIEEVYYLIIGRYIGDSKYLYVLYKLTDKMFMSLDHLGRLIISYRIYRNDKGVEEMKLRNLKPGDKFSPAYMSGIEEYIVVDRNNSVTNIYEDDVVVAINLSNGKIVTMEGCTDVIKYSSFKGDN